MKGIPKKKEPIEHILERVEQYSQIPPGLFLPGGLDYNTKHLELQAFVNELVLETDKSKLDAFILSSLTEHQLTSQFQRVFNKIALPKELKRPPVKRSMESIERLKLGLRDVIIDWDALINLIYGLALLKKGKVPTWVSLRKVALGSKVDFILQEPRLVSLVKKQWIIVRNSLNHGSAFYVPEKEGIEFHDRDRTVCWSVDEIFLEGINIYLVNSAILRVDNFIKMSEAQSFREKLDFLRNLAQQ